MDRNRDPLTDVFEDYIFENHKNELVDIMKAVESEKHYSIGINFMLLFEKHVELGSSILSNASVLLPQLEQRLISTQKKILRSIEEDNGENLIPKTNIHVRISHLPSIPQIHLSSFPLNRDVGNLVQVCATVTRTTSSKMLEYRREYLCSKCRQIFPVYAEYEMYYTIKPPGKCLNSDCPGKNLAPIKMIDQLNYKDYQEIKIQEQVGKLGIGTVPRSMWATLEDDLVDICKPGDDVKICGVVTRRWKSAMPGSRHDIELYLRVNHLSVSNNEKMSVLITNETITQFEQFWRDNYANALLARDLIIASICPQVYGLYLVKLAVAITLAGGVCKQESGGCRVRGEPHMLLVGDPGTGKSHIIKFASKISSRAVHTTGIGSTSAGLTVSAVHEQGEWQLEAGALVLADGGICCIDEFSAIREHDRTTIHEAMEQQTISVAKAGVVCKLNTRCSLIAATNPKGHYDPNIPLSVNIGIASPLLSRFDLVLVLLDSRNSQWDKTISDFILRGKSAYKTSSKTSLWNVEKLLEYFSVIKTLNPKMSADANIVLCTYYQNQRKADFRNAARTTVRLLESLIRLSQGHARLMFREDVLVQDAIIAISLVESSMMGTALLNNVDTLHATFPVDPLIEYKNQARALLGKLQLHDILRKEMDAYGYSNSQNVLPVPCNLHEGDEPERDVTKRNQNLATIVTNIRRNKERSMFDSLMRKRLPQKTRNKTKKIENNKSSHVRTKNKNSRSSVQSASSALSSDEGIPEESVRLDIHSKRRYSNEDDLSVLLNLSSDSDLEDRKNPPKKPDSRTTSSAKSNTRKKIVRISKTSASNRTEEALQDVKAERKNKSSYFSSSDDSVSSEISKKRLRTNSEIDAAEKPSSAVCSEDAAEKLGLFSEFKAESRIEEKQPQKRSVSSKTLNKLQRFAHVSRTRGEEEKPQECNEQPSVGPSQSSIEMPGTTDNILQETFVDALFSEDDETGVNSDKRESSSLESSQKTLFSSQATAVPINRIFSMYSATADEDLSFLDDV